MALTKKMMKAMNLEDAQIEQIFEAHEESINALRETRNNLQADLDKANEQLDQYKNSEKTLKKVQEELDKLKEGDWENKYSKLKSEYDGYKADVETKAVTAQKADAYKKLLKDAGVSDKRIDSILKITKLDDLKLNKEGAFEGADKLTESIKSEWADFIVTTQERGANVTNPPANNGGEISKPSEAALRMQNYMAEHYGKAKED